MIGSATIRARSLYRSAAAAFYLTGTSGWRHQLAARKFYLLDLVVYPQDIFWLAGLLMIVAYLLLFVTGLAGRVFCGCFCFQTLWTDVYIGIERLVQGERPARIRLAKQPWSVGKAFKIGLTHGLWLLVALLTGITFVLYWDYAPQLLRQFFAGEAPFAAYATTYVMAGIACEQVCTYMCHVSLCALAVGNVRRGYPDRVL